MRRASSGSVIWISLRREGMGGLAQIPPVTTRVWPLT